MALRTKIQTQPTLIKNTTLLPFILCLAQLPLQAQGRHAECTIPNAAC